MANQRAPKTENMASQAAAKNSGQKGQAVEKPTAQKPTQKKKTANTTNAAKNPSQRKNTAKKQPDGAKQYKEEPISDSMKDEIILAGTLLVSILFFLSYINLCGAVGRGLNFVVFGMMGVFAYLFPFLLFLLVAFGMSNRGNRLAKRKIWSILGCFFCIAALIELASGFEAETKWHEYFTLSAEHKNGGGIVGGSLVKLLCPLFDTVATAVILVILLLICLMLLTGRELFAYIKKRTSETVEGRRTWTEESEKRGQKTFEETDIAERRQAQVMNLKNPNLSEPDYMTLGSTRQKQAEQIRFVDALKARGEKKASKQKIQDIPPEPMEPVPESVPEPTKDTNTTEQDLQEAMDKIQISGQYQREEAFYYEDELKRKFGNWDENAESDHTPKEKGEQNRSVPFRPAQVNADQRNISQITVGQTSISQTNIGQTNSGQTKPIEELEEIEFDNIWKKSEKIELIRNRAEAERLRGLELERNLNETEKPEIERNQWKPEKTLDETDRPEIEGNPWKPEKTLGKTERPEIEGNPWKPEKTLEKTEQLEIEKPGLERDRISLESEKNLKNIELTRNWNHSEEQGNTEVISGFSRLSGLNEAESELDFAEQIPFIQNIQDTALSQEQIWQQDTAFNRETIRTENAAPPQEQIWQQDTAFNRETIRTENTVLPQEQIWQQDTALSQETIRTENAAPPQEQMWQREQIRQRDTVISNQKAVRENRVFQSDNSQNNQNSQAAAEVAAELAIQPVLEKKYEFPPIELLAPPKPGRGANERELKETAIKLQKTLESFGVRVTVTNISCGPAVTQYELQPEQGVKVSQITKLTDDIKLNMAAADIRIEAPIPGKAAVGIEIPNKEATAVVLRELLESREFNEHKSKLAFAVGKNISGQTIVSDIAKMPHMLIAGATGSGKSVCINTIIMSILYKADPKDVKLIMVDPKVVELSIYNGIPHLLIPVVTDPKKASAALNWAVMEMTDRYKKFADLGVRDLAGYNERVKSAKGQDSKYPVLPQIVIIVDELADLMMVASGEVEEAICRLAQMARAAGLHLIIATQRPSVNVITGLIKANVPSRVAFAVTSVVDSRTILDGAGAEKLLGRGDMLFFPSGYPKPVRIQGAFVSDAEVSAVVEFLKEQSAGSGYSEEVSRQITSSSMDGGSASGDQDDYFVEAGRLIIEKEKASIGMLQRAYKIGFNRAARIMDQLTAAGVVGPEEGTKPRKILMTAEEFEQQVVNM